MASSGKTIKLNPAAIKGNAGKLGSSATAMAAAYTEVQKANALLSKWTGAGSENIGKITELFEAYFKGISAAGMSEYIKLVKIQGKYTSVDEVIKKCFEDPAKRVMKKG
jgi:uncharacterized protein YukE